MKDIFRPAKISSQTFQIHAAPVGQHLHLRGWSAERFARPGLAAAHPAVLTPILRHNALMLRTKGGRFAAAKGLQSRDKQANREHKGG